MRLLFINQFFFPDMAATSQMLTDLAVDLAKEGVQVTVLTSRAHYLGEPVSLPSREVYRGITILRVHGTNFGKRSHLGRAMDYLSFYLSALFRLLLLRKQDGVIALSTPPFIAILGIMAKKLQGARFIYWVQDLYPEVAVRLRVLKEDARLTRLLAKLSSWTFKQADLIVVLGDWMKKLVLAKGVSENTIAAQPNWADGIELFPVPHEQNWFRKEHDLTDKFVVMYSGNLGMGHVFDEILEGAKALRDRHEIQFVFVGDGVRRGQILKFVQEHRLCNALFLPYQAREDLRYSLSAGDVHLVSLMPGLEGHIVPSKLYGIMAVGRPVIHIGSESSEIGDLILRSGCGEVIPPRDHKALCDAVLKLYGNPWRRNRMGIAGRSFFEKHLDRRLATHRFYEIIKQQTQNIYKQSLAKRLFDICLSGGGLLGSLPLWALITLGIKLEDRGPVFYRQERVGKDGRIFRALKFRSMIPEAEEGLGPIQATADDARVTRIGRILRATAMDELPQLWNIFIGDMSFVGPRALRPVEIEVKSPGPGAMGIEALPNFKLRHQVRPGLTGLAQVYAPRDATRRQKLRFDLLYIKRQSFRLDFKLILISFYITFRGRWEQRRKKF